MFKIFIGVPEGRGNQDMLKVSENITNLIRGNVPKGRHYFNLFSIGTVITFFRKIATFFQQ